MPGRGAINPVGAAGGWGHASGDGAPLRREVNLNGQDGLTDALSRSCNLGHDSPHFGRGLCLSDYSIGPPRVLDGDTLTLDEGIVVDQTKLTQQKTSVEMIFQVSSRLNLALIEIKVPKYLDGHPGADLCVAGEDVKACDALEGRRLSR